ncbi:PREDICTED: TP53-regulating kinase [Prunus dulcis]|uniref:non-specific serine/threonine protein kinase n=3 Tax=Prunus dulcis TaxID=3755 RepID=A0A5E4EDP1_PRUDU|nr:PREDICTED: TP53-regulating kinase [Prunus dulcis]
MGLRFAGPLIVPKPAQYNLKRHGVVLEWENEGGFPNSRKCREVFQIGGGERLCNLNPVLHGSLSLIKQGAEARVFESSFVGRRSIVKERFSKKYRHPSLDAKLTLKRLNAEARCMTKARRLGVYTPVLYSVDIVLHTLTFEYVEGPSVKDIFLEFGLRNGAVVEERMDDIAMQIGHAIGKLHDGGLIHGDLTTSNMLIRAATNQLVVIDFGLSFTSTLPEDKAVDLYVLERALLSMHSSCGNVMDRILAAYRKSSKQWSSTLNKLAQVLQMDHSLYNTHVKLLAFDLLTLTQTSSSSSSSDPVSFSRNGALLSRAETVGTVTSRDLKPNKFLRFTIDDGTGCVNCILWLNQLSSPYFSRRNPADVRLIAQTAQHFAAEIKLGVIARVRGKITSYRGVTQITALDVVVERDPNVEILHWLDCMRLARKVYNVVPPCK